MALAADRILDIVSRAPGAAAGMHELISESASRQPHPDWALVGALDWSAEVMRLAGWLTTLMSDEPAGAQMTGVYFGLFNPVVDGETVADLYVAGAPRDASDPEWCCAVASHWWPKGRYSNSPLLAQIYRLAYQDEGVPLGNDMEYPIVLGFACMAVRELVDRIPGASWLGTAVERWLVIGFDSGDRLQLGRITADGFSPALDWV